VVVVISIIPLVNLAMMVIGPVLYGGLMYACDQQRKTGKVEIGNLFAGLQRQTGPLFLLGAIYLGFMAICFFVMFLTAGSGIASAMFLSHNPTAMANAFAGPGFAIGLLLYFGLLFLAMAAMWFSPTLVILHGVPPVEALKTSFTAAFRNFLPGLVYSVLLFLLLIVGAIPLLLGYLIVVPMFVISFYTAYRDIFIEA
jgi:uncharacterized membrane protein